MHVLRYFRYPVKQYRNERKRDEYIETIREISNIYVIIIINKGKLEIYILKIKLDTRFI